LRSRPTHGEPRERYARGRGIAVAVRQESFPNGCARTSPPWHPAHAWGSARRPARFRDPRVLRRRAGHRRTALPYQVSYAIDPPWRHISLYRPVSCEARITGLFMHARLAWPGYGRPSTQGWRIPASGRHWPLVLRPSSSPWLPSRSRCWCPATARWPARGPAIRQERQDRPPRCRRLCRGRARSRSLQHPRRRLTRPRRLRLRAPLRL